nr:MAG TPA: hypothetical protein [Caudoviricetes sp.]
MNKAVMLSIRPKWVEKIASGEKTIEVRKTKPKLETPFKAYIYCSQGNDARRLRDSWGKVIGEFTCDRIFPINVFDSGSIQNWLFEHMKRSCLTYEELADYIGNGKTGHGWHISDLRIYDQPQELTAFRRACPNSWYCESCAMYWENNGTCGNESLYINRPPQSWCYVEEG